MEPILFLDNNEIPVGALARSRNIVKDWNLNNFSDVDKTMLGTIQEITENIEFPESGMADILKKCATSNQWSEGLGAETVDSSGKMLSISVNTLDSILGEVELKERSNHIGNRCNDPISLPIGLKLDQLVDHREVRSISSSKGSSLVSFSRFFIASGKSRFSGG